jgi:hypothetical protein
VKFSSLTVPATKKAINEHEKISCSFKFPKPKGQQKRRPPKTGFRGSLIKPLRNPTTTANSVVFSFRSLKLIMGFIFAESGAKSKIKKKTTQTAFLLCARKLLLKNKRSVIKFKQKHIISALEQICQQSARSV